MHLERRYYLSLVSFLTMSAIIDKTSDEQARPRPNHIECIFKEPISKVAAYREHAPG